MDIKNLISIIKNKITNNISYENILIEDKSFLHKNHLNNDANKFHIKLIISSKELKGMKKIESNKKIYKILDKEIKDFIHSLQISIR